MARFDKLAQTVLQSQGQSGGVVSQGNQSVRLMYPAVVISSEDPMGMKRVVARIVEIDDNGNFTGGRDRDTPEEELQFCVPLMPNHFHIVPIEGEMIYVILENPSDNSAQRYYIGSQINSPFKLKFQEYKEANRVFLKTKFNLNQNPNSNIDAKATFPKVGEIAVQGRDDADLILRPREAFLVVGKFNKGTMDINTENPSSIQLKQFENEVKNENGDRLIPKYSQANIYSSNINIFSILGKFRDSALSEFEINEDLKSFGEVASQLHPAVFGDELIKLLDLIIRVLLNHIHTPHMPLISSSESNILSSYTVDGELQRIISNHIRIN